MFILEIMDAVYSGLKRRAIICPVINVQFKSLMGTGVHWWLWNWKLASLERTHQRYIQVLEQHILPLRHLFQGRP